MEIPPEEVGNEALTNGGEAQSETAAEASIGSVATLSSPWQFDDLQTTCTACCEEFTPFNRRHHCRLCGKIFCHNCTKQRALIPPSSIVLTPKGGKKAKPRSAMEDSITFSPEEDPDRMLTYLTNSSSSPSSGENNNNNNNNNKQLLYGKGLEERFQLAREPLRVCPACYQQLAPLQADLRNSNSNAMRFNYIDPTDPRRLFNSPLAFTLGHEIRKAAYTLNNLLPQPKRRMGAVVVNMSSSSSSADAAFHMETRSSNELQQCKETCMAVSPNLGDLDGVRIPARLLEQAKGIAVMTVVKGGFGLAGVEFGTGLVVARLDDNNNSSSSSSSSSRWSAPSAIGTAGLSWGALVGAQVSDHVFLLMNYAAVEMLFNDKGSVQLGADVGVALGPLGRALEADLGAAAPGNVAPIYTYSMSKGLYAGISLDGKVIGTREHVNEKFYGRRVSAREILAGAVPTPPAASPLYEALQRCHVYATGVVASHRQHQQHQLHHPPPTAAPAPAAVWPSLEEAASVMGEYGEVMQPPLSSSLSPMLQQQQQQQTRMMMMPPAAADQHSYAGMSDLSDPGY